MKYKKSLLFICLIICLFSIASVCASDVNETVVTSEDQSDEILTVEDNNENVVTSEDQSDELINVEKVGNDSNELMDANENQEGDTDKNRLCNDMLIKDNNSFEVDINNSHNLNKHDDLLSSIEYNIMSFNENEDTLGSSPPYNAYSCTLYDVSICFDNNEGHIVPFSMSYASSSSSYTYKYDFYLKVYDSNGNQKISQRYNGGSNSISPSMYIDATKLSLGKYTMKIINYADNKVMSTSNLYIVNIPHNAYTIKVSNSTIISKNGGTISKSMSYPSSYTYKYDFYLKVYDSNGNQKISQRYYSTESSSPNLNINANQLTPGIYTVKIFNNVDDYLMSTANLYVVNLRYYDYNVKISNSTIISREGGKIIMDISHASSSYDYRYDFYLKVYDSNGDEKISQRYYSTDAYNGIYSSSRVTHNISADQLAPGIYTIKLLNNIDDYVMKTVKLVVVNVPSTVYSVSTSNTKINCSDDGNIQMIIIPANSSFNYKYDFYLKVYDSNGDEKISQRYYSTSFNYQENYTININQLIPGNYTIKLLNNGDNYLITTANLTVNSVPSNSYSVNVSDTTLTYGVGGKIIMDISPASSQYSNKYDFYLKVYDSNGDEKISQRYYSTSPSSQIIYNITKYVLSSGVYLIKILNSDDNQVMSTANLFVVSLPHNVYSVNVSNTIITYKSSGSILINVTPANSSFNYKYDFYLKVCDSNGDEKISQRYYSTSSSSILQLSYSVSSNLLNLENYTIKILNYGDNYLMDSANLTVIALTSDVYSVNVNDTIISYESGGDVKMNVTPSSSIYAKKYDFYLKIYDSNGNQKISQRYYDTNSNYELTYNVPSNKLSPGNYTIKLVNYYDDQIMDVANLTVISLNYMEYSVKVDETTTVRNGVIVMNITSSSSIHSKKYDFYLKVYDLNGTEKISRRYYSSNYNSSSNFQLTYNSLNSLDTGQYIIKIINYYDSIIMSMANLYIVTLYHNAYSVNVDDTKITYGASGSIIINVNHADTSYTNYRYDFYLKVYDLNGTEKISRRYSTSYSVSTTNKSNAYYTISSTELIPGKYIIKILNNGDNYLMDSANLTVIALTSNDYSVYVSNTVLTYSVGGNIIMRITPASSKYNNRYDFYLKVYDSEGNQKISKRYYSSSYNSQESYSVSSNMLSPGNYTIKILNYYDNDIIDLANLTVIALTSTAYSVNVFDTIITYSVGGSIVMNVTPSSSIYAKKYDFYLKIYDSNGAEKISQQYSSTSSSSQLYYSLSSTQLNPGIYTIKIMNNYDKNIMNSANLTIIALTSTVYSVNVSNTTIIYGKSGRVVMNVTPSSSIYAKKYDFYLKIYDSNGAEKISQQYSSTSSSSQLYYSLSSTQLNPGIYTIKIMNNYDKNIMNSANLTIISVPHIEYGLNVSDLKMNYGTNESILISISPTFGYVYAYDFYLNIYDSNDNQKLSQRYYDTVSVNSINHRINSSIFGPGIYTIKLLNNVDNHLMAAAKLYVLDSPNIELYSSDYYIDEIIKINYDIESKATGFLSIYINDSFIKNISVGKNIEIDNLSAGSYTVNVVYNGDEYYAVSNNNVTINVRKYTPTFSFTKNNAIAGDEFVITYILNSDATGTIICNNSTKQLINGRVNFNINNIKGGLHQFNISYSGDDKYNPMNKTVNVTIKFKDAIVDFDVNDIIWSDSLTVAPTLTAGATGYLNIYIDNNLNSTININGKRDFTFYVGGYHYIKISYSGDEYYASNSTTKGFNVIKLNSTCDIKGNIETDNSATVYVTLNEDATGKVSIYIRGIKYTSNLIGGVATFRVPSLAAGTYTVTIDYEGDSKYNSIYTTKTLEVTLKPSTIALNVRNILTGNNLVITPIVTSSASGSLKIYVDNVLKKTIDIGSSYTITTPSIGKHDVRVVYAGDSYHQGNETKTTFRVFTFYPIEVQNTAIIYGTDKHFKAIFYDEYGDVAANKLVAFNINGEDTVVMTDSNGLASFNKDLPIGTYAVTVINAYVNEEHTYTLKVFTSIESEDITRAYNTGMDFKVKLLDENADTLSRGYALFNVNNKDYPVVADNNGIAVLNANLPVGTYTVTTTNGRTGETKTNKITIVPSVEATNMVRGYNSGVDFKAKFLDADAKPLVNQKVAFKIGFTEYEATTDTNGFAVLNEPLDVGKYEVTAINKVTGEKATRNLTIVERIVENNDVIRIYGEESYYTIHVVGDDGNFVGENEVVNININNIDYQIRTDKNGYASFRIDENIGSYDILAEYKGYEVYNDVYVLQRVNYIKNLNVTNINYKQNEVVNLNLSSFDNLAYVEFEIVGDNGYNKIFRQSAGSSISLPVTGLNAGKYTVTARYYDLNTFKFSSMVKAFNVNKINPKIIVVVEDANVGETATITVNIPDVEGNVEIKVGNALSFNEYLVKNGVIIKEIDSLPAGTYNVDVTYIGDNNYNRLTQSVTLTIIQPKILTNIVASDITITQGNGATLVATLKDDYGKVLVGKGVSIYFNGRNSILTTDNNGQVKLTLANNLAPNTYSATITFIGDDYYVGSKTTVKVTINNVPATKITLTLKKVKVKRSAKKLVITATLKVNGKAVKGKTIKFKFNKKSYKARTNAKGVAKIKVTKKVLKKLKAGKKVKYQATYGKITKKVTVKVKK